MSEPMMDYTLVRTLQEQVGNRLADDRQHRIARQLPDLDDADLRQLSLSLTRQVVASHVSSLLRQRLEVPEGDWDERLVAAIDAAIWGAGELQQLLDDPAVENIDINGCDHVFVGYADERGTVRVGPVAASDEELIETVRTLGAHAMNARPLTPSSPQLDMRLPDGSRLSAIMSVSERFQVSIRRNRFPLVFLADPPPTMTRTRGARVGSPPAPAASLLQLGTDDQQLADFLSAAVRARSNIVVAGATNAGKTTLLRALIHCIPAHERLIIVERALELGIGKHEDLHPNTVEMEEILPGADGAGGVSIRDLVLRTRRQNPSRVIVGEVMGPEVVEMLMAMSQGNDGSLSTVHARSAVDVFDRLAVYASMYTDLAVDTTHALIGATVDFVVFVAQNPLLGDRRTVTEVVEVTGASNGRVSRSRIFTPSPVDGHAERDTEVPISGPRAAKLARAGYDDTTWVPTWNGHLPDQHHPAGASPYGYRGDESAYATDPAGFQRPFGRR